MINFFKEKILLENKDDVIKLHLVIKSFQKNYNLSRADIDTLFELYKTGYNDQFYKNCIDKEYFKTKQTVRNSVAKMTNLGILSYKKRGERSVAEDFVPKIDTEKAIFQYLVGNVDGSTS
jgi:predicted transcriptional regulator